MSNQEFFYEFDILYNSITSNQAPGLNAYEKSVLLTDVQEDVVQELYSGALTGESFENTEKLRRCLDTLIKTDYPKLSKAENKGISTKSYFYNLNDDVLFITYESVDIDKGSECGTSTVEVVPVKQDEWHKIKNNPFKRPNKHRVVRLDSNDRTLELISEYPISNYLIRYIRKPRPIVIGSLEPGLTVNGVSVNTECELNPVLHRIILKRAVALASSIYKQG